MSRALDVAMEAWGTDLPAWIVLLCEQCDRSSQRAVGVRLGYSAAVVSLVIKRKYTGSLDRVEQAVRGAFQDAKVQCPVLGQIDAQRCTEHQRAPFGNANPTRVRLYRACNGGCPHSFIKAGGAGKESS